jgi:hypothetical protein
LALLALLALLVSCRDAPSPARLQREVADAAPPWATQVRAPTPPRGMVWIPDGTLIAGTPAGKVPRLADIEMAGEPLELHGFFIDQFSYPNEEGAIPHTGVTRAQADGLCQERGKRLCTELEWERACKGPRNLSYEYGDRHRSEVCQTGRAPRLLPSGYRTSCRSDFGVRDLHGGVWEWTQSRWGRGSAAELFSVRGGNSSNGELSGRCANAMPRPQDVGSSEVGFRCCKGEVNEASVRLRTVAGKTFEPRARPDAELRAQLLESLPPDVREVFAAPDALSFSFNGAWDWRPMGNVPLLIATGCDGVRPNQRCGALVAELVPAPQLLGWFWVGIFPPVVRLSKWDPKKLWISGGDRRSTFRQALHYEWGRIRAGELVRNE